ncbi:MAG: hypothetical protein CMK59_12930 [Proteobacteria bacterium]|nr:hypothetical protein [Pseudomonadota bacterium]
MLNTKQFVNLIPYVLRSVPYIHQSHTCKAYCALEQLFALKPHLPDDVWTYCASIITDDEPKVKGVMIPELMGIERVVDHTSGRNFGPDWILGRGLMPLSYWAMHKKVEQQGFEAVVKEYIDKALAQPRFLGHEISILSAAWRFYQDVVVGDSDEERQVLFLQRFTEFVTVTFAHGDQGVIEHCALGKAPISEAELLPQALCNPGFFGHHILAFVWGNRMRPLLNQEQQEQLSLSQMSLFGAADVQEASKVCPLDVEWDDHDFDVHLTEFFRNGPKNIHQITLAEALLWCWSNAQEHRRLIAANLLCFTKATLP